MPTHPAVLGILTDAVGWLVAGTLALWFTVSLAAQFGDGVHDRIPRVSALGLIPRWAFFAPRPAMDDTCLLYRDRLADGTVCDLTCLSMPEPRRWFHAVWNPRKFHSKVIDDLMSSLVTQKRQMAANDVDERALMLTVPYLAILHLVLRNPVGEGAVARQFVIVHSRTYAPDPHPTIGFVSEFHPFSRVSESCF